MISNGMVVTGTLVDKVLQCVFSLVKCAFNFNQTVENAQTESGVVDTLRSLLMHEHFIKPYSEEHI